MSEGEQKSDCLIFLTCLQRESYHNKVTRLSLVMFSGLVDAPCTVETNC